MTTATIQTAIERLEARRRPVTAVMIEMEIGESIDAETKAAIAAAVERRLDSAFAAIDRSRARRAAKPTAAAPKPAARLHSHRAASWCRRCHGPCADGSGYCGEC
jgi:hypothetical protein